LDPYFAGTGVNAGAWSTANQQKDEADWKPVSAHRAGG
jgi:hypothetical protein